MLLVARDTVNTMPEATLDAVRQSGVYTGDTITLNISSAKSTLGKLALVGIDLEKITNLLESDGVSKFEASWLDLMNSIKTVSGK
jgi:transaldolase